MEPQYVVALIMTGLGVVAWFLMAEWKKSWENRILAQDERLDIHERRHGKHDVNHAILSANLEHVRTAVDETHADVRELLKQSGQRSTSRG